MFFCHVCECSTTSEHKKTVSAKKIQVRFIAFLFQFILFLRNILVLRIPLLLLCFFRPLSQDVHPDFFAVHMHADPKDIIPLETDFDELAGVGVSDNSDSDIEGADNVEFRQFKRSATSSRMVKGVLVPRDVRKLTVGKVAAHWRIMLTPMTVGDFVAFRYKEEKSSSDLDDSDPDTDDEDIGDLLGVGQVLAILSDNRYTIRWHGPKDPKASQNLRLGASLFPGYYQATEKREPYYDTSPIKKHDDEMIEDMLLYEEAIVIHGFKLTPKSRKLPLKIQRRICGVSVLPHRIKGHKAKCECMAE